ncbi:adenylate/guanylate cyclase domain-containing protein [Janthinobacterium sp. 17J80-10]|uniref:adenylate/guanylate cyclase domain-containing protein n=1 Tax=Janthinobacterium sp. 17J80-10 TaxID=2497863 RepID=UPI0013E8D79E|nr:adenylate/guanylate cyclase domain-containing protein [Janthinobacterium sp. 17J80-10]
MRFLFSSKDHHSSWRWHGLLALLFVAALALELFGVQLFALTESRLADVYQRRHAAELAPDPDIMVVDIDDASMVEMQEIAGLWSWSREIHADLLEVLNEFRPRAIVFDMTFSVRDARRPAGDARLDEAVNASAAVYLAATRLAADRDAAGAQLAPLAAAFGMAGSGAANARAAIELPHAIEPGVWRLGLINSAKDDDGRLRRYRLYTDVQGWRLPSLPARVVQGLAPGRMQARGQGGRLPDGGDFLMRWAGDLHRHISYGTLYKTLTQNRMHLGEAERRAYDATLAPLFQNKIIVIGSSASSSFDHHLTPLGSNIPGVDILATAIDNLKNGHVVRPVPVVVPFAFGALLIAALAWAFALRSNPMAIGLALALVSLAALAAADAALARDRLLPVATPLAVAWAWYLLAAIGGYLRERRSREQAVALFGRFLNPNVVRQIVEQGETVESMSGRTSQLTVLFSDIRGFTTLSETRDPHEVVNLLNRYFERQVDVVFRHGGTLDKFIGDCIMAFWGAPVDDPAHAAHAVAAALEMQEVLLEFKQELQGEGADIAGFDVGIGVHSGPAVVGFIGAQKKLDYTAIGDTVNLASRVEGLTKGVARVLVTRDTVQACGADAAIDFIARGAFAVKGRAAAVELFEPVRKS